MPILLRTCNRAGLAAIAGMPAVAIAELGRRDAADKGRRKWQVAYLMSARDAAKSKFQRSVERYVDDRDKIKSFATIVGTVFDAICSDDYQDVLQGGPVSCKVAKSFKYAGQNHNLWEFKYGNKDRLYFVSDVRNGTKTIILLMAFHKKDTKTPEEVEPCIVDAKLFLADKGKFEYC